MSDFNEIDCVNFGIHCTIILSAETLIEIGSVVCEILLDKFKSLFRQVRLFGKIWLIKEVTVSYMYLDVIFSSKLTHTANIAKYSNSVNNGTREMKFGAPDGGDDGEYNGVGFVEISRLFAMYTHLPLEWYQLTESIPWDNSHFIS